MFHNIQRLIQTLAVATMLWAVFISAQSQPALAGDPEEHPAVINRSSPALMNGPGLQPVDGDMNSLDDYLRYALVHNAGLQAAYQRIKAAELQVPQAEALPDPRFSYSYMPRSLETRVGPLRQKFGFSQTLPWFGKRDLRGSAADQQAHVEEEKLRAAVLKVFRDIKLLFWEYQYLARAVEVTRENIQLLTRLEAVIRSQYSVGRANYADTIKSGLALARLEDRLTAFEASREPLVAKLNAAMNRPQTTPLPWPRKQNVTPLLYSDEDLLNRLALNQPELVILDIQANGEDIRAELARKENLPDLTFGVEYSDMGPARMPDVPDSGKNALGVSVSINLPIWRDRTEAARIQATRRKLQLQAERVNREQLLQADLKWVLFQYREAQRREQLYADTLLPMAEQTMIAAEKAFITSQGSFLDLLDAQRSLLTLHLERHRLQADQYISLAQVEYLAGEEWSASVDKDWLGSIADSTGPFPGADAAN